MRTALCFLVAALVFVVGYGTGTRSERERLSDLTVRCQLTCHSQQGTLLEVNVVTGVCRCARAVP